MFPDGRLINILDNRSLSPDGNVTMGAERPDVDMSEEDVQPIVEPLESSSSCSSTPIEMDDYQQNEVKYASIFVLS